MTDALRLTARGLLFRNRRYPVEIGRGGLSTTKREGDGATPIATLHILGMYWRADRLPRPAPWARPIGPRDLWCDAPDHPSYNHPIRSPFPASHEALRRADPLYDIVLITDWNHPQARPGLGSAIFLHQRRRQGYPTAGCLAFRRDHLIEIASALRPGTPLIVPDIARFQWRKISSGESAEPADGGRQPPSTLARGDKA